MMDDNNDVVDTSSDMYNDDGDSYVVVIGMMMTIMLKNIIITIMLKNIIITIMLKNIIITIIILIMMTIQALKSVNKIHTDQSI